jgi:hypothetical protein
MKKIHNGGIADMVDKSAEEFTSLPELVRQNLDLYRQTYREFAKIFGVSLRSYWNNITGFDIVMFDDEFIKSPDNKSMGDAILETYGQEAYDLIRRLISLEE